MLSSLSLLGCETATVAKAIEPPADRMDCRELEGGRPAIPAEYVIDWNTITSVQQARSEHESFVRSVRSREGVTVGHIVAIESRLFACSNDAAWLRDFFAGLPNAE